MKGTENESNSHKNVLRFRITISAELPYFNNRC